MPEYLAPGVYVEEVDTGLKPIEGVSTSTAGMVGVTERGPVNVPILITSRGEFGRWFGELLDVAEFSNVHGPHCFLPHAVEGFFTNGGKRLYVTRVLRDDAHRASFELRDRGPAGAFESLLLRSARQSTGTLVDPPLVSILDTGGLNNGDRLRIGDGSQAEYRRVASAPGATRHVALAFPTARGHDAGATIQKFDRTPDAGYTGGPFNPTADVEAGAQALEVTGAAADMTTLGLASPPILVEIGALAHAEHRLVTAIDGATITLDSALTQSYLTTDPVTVLDMTVGPVDTTLLVPAAAAATVLFGDDLQTQFIADDLVRIDTTLPDAAEVRRIGALHELEPSGGAYDAYPAGSTVERFLDADDDRQVTGAINTDTLTVDPPGNVEGLAPGLSITIDPGGTNETHVIQAVDDATPAITLTANLAAAYAGATMQVAARQITAAAAAGSVTLSLDSRLGLAADDVLHLGVAPADEFVTVEDLVGDAGPAPDAGAVVLTAPTRRDHARTTPVRRQVMGLDGDTGNTLHAAYLSLAAAEGAETLIVSDDDSFAATTLVRVTTPGDLTFYHRLEDNAAALAPREVELDRPLDRNHPLGAPVVQRDPLLDIEALDAGSWANRLWVSAEDEPNGLVTGASLAVVHPLTQEIELTSQTGVEVGTVLELLPADDGNPIGPPLKVEGVNRNNNRVALAAPLTNEQDTAHNTAIGLGQMLRVRSREFRLTVRLLQRPDPVTPIRNRQELDSEFFDHLSMDPRHSRYFRSIIGNADVLADESNLRQSDRRTEGASWYVRARDLEANQAAREAVRLGPEALTDAQPSGLETAARFRLAGGDDALLLLDDDDYVGDDSEDPPARTGLFSLANEEDISVVACPGRTGTQIQGALIAHCEEMRYRFAILDGPPSPNDSINDVRAQRQQFDTKYAALYHPWLQVPHPYPPVPSPALITYQVPPSGHLAGVYARTDIERGVHKAPANEVVRGIVGLQQQLNKREQDVLNPSPTNINVIRDFRRQNRSIRVYGGRVITSDSDWKYVNVRRLLIFLEHSIERGLQWVVFEPNAEPLWARVRRTITNFLTVVWRNGALEGAKVEEAFYVKCDRTTMTQTDIDNGRLICLIGVAPVKPAEFVIIRIGLWTAHADN